MKQAYLKLHIAVILAGFTGVFGRLITLNEGLISWYRTLLSGLVMLLFLAISGRFEKITKSEKLRIASAGTLLGFHWLFFYGSIKYSNISVGVVCFALTSFFNAVLSPLINKSKLSVQELLLSSITLCGIALIFGMDTNFRTGVILGIISSFFGGAYTVYNERFANAYRGQTIILYQMFGGLAGLTLAMPVFFADYTYSYLTSLAARFRLVAGAFRFMYRCNVCTYYWCINAHIIIYGKSYLQPRATIHYTACRFDI